VTVETNGKTSSMYNEGRPSDKKKIKRNGTTTKKKKTINTRRSDQNNDRMNEDRIG